MLKATIRCPRGGEGSRASTLIHGPNHSTNYVHRVTETTPQQHRPHGSHRQTFTLTTEGNKLCVVDPRG